VLPLPHPSHWRFQRRGRQVRTLAQSLFSHVLSHVPTTKARPARYAHGSASRFHTYVSQRNIYKKLVGGRVYTWPGVAASFDMRPGRRHCRQRQDEAGEEQSTGRQPRYAKLVSKLVVETPRGFGKTTYIVILLTYWAGVAGKERRLGGFNERLREQEMPGDSAKLETARALITSITTLLWQGKRGAVSEASIYLSIFNWPTRVLRSV
jgi:hypothetical protein